MKIKKISKIDYDGDVYNLRVSDNHNYFAENLCVSNCHQGKIKSIQSILERTFGHATYRFGLSGTFPEDMSCEILAIQSITGPKITDITAKKLIDEGSITPMDIKVMHINHDDVSFDTILRSIRKNPNRGIEAYQAEREYVQKSKRRKDFVKKLIEKCTKNTLVLFNTIDYGNPLYKELLEEVKDKEFHYIDGSISSKERSRIKAAMDLDDGKVRILIASFGTLSTGVSIKNLHNIIFIESFKSPQRIIQSIGRGLRLFDGKKTANIFDLVDIFVEENPRNAFYKHGQERMRLYKHHSYPYKELNFNL